MAGKNKSWPALEAEYIKHKMSYKKLAEKYSMSAKTISRYGAEHNWVAKRARFAEKVGTKTAEKLAERESNKLVRLCEAADSLAETIKNATDDPKQFQRRTIIDPNGNVKEVELKSMNAAAIRQMTGALKDLAAVMRDVYGIPQENIDQSEIKIEFTLPKEFEGFDV